MRPVCAVLCFLFTATACPAEQKIVRPVTKAETRILEGLFPSSTIISEHTYFITVNGFKNVHFVSIVHHSAGSEYLTFYAVKGREVLRELPIASVNEYVRKEVKAVSFMDMNKDGYSDVTVLVDCFSGAGDMGAVPYHVASIFINNMRGGFDNDDLVDEDICARLNENEDFNSIEAIAAYVDAAYNRRPPAPPEEFPPDEDAP